MQNALNFVRAVAAAAIVIATPIDAATPYVTDDARLIDTGACQLETWVQKNRDSTEYWALPACNLAGKLDLTLGGARTRVDGETKQSDVQIQAKTVFTPMTLDQWGVGLSAGTIRHPVDRTRDWYATLIASRAFMDERVVAHVNVGWLRDGEVQRQRATWGTALEWRIAADTWLIGELFGQNRGRPSHQVGLRYSLVPDRVQIDVTYGNRNGGGADERWYAVGLRLVSSPLTGGGK